MHLIEAIYLTVKHFRYFVEGCEFSVLTDHKPLTYALSGRPDRYSPRQSRHLDFISQFTSDIRHVRGTDNTVADTLSRIPINALHTGGSVPVVDFRAMAASQVNDPDPLRLRADSSMKLSKFYLHCRTGFLFSALSRQGCNVHAFLIVFVG